MAPIRGWLINFGLIPNGAVHKNSIMKDWFTSYVAANMIEKEEVMNKRPFASCNRGHTYLIEFMRYYLRVATLSFAGLHVRLLFEGGYYLGCGFYSNKYG